MTEEKDKIPERIWLQIHENQWTWCEDQIEDTDIEYRRVGSAKNEFKQVLGEYVRVHYSYMEPYSRNLSERV
jgi:hypothetical protein